MTATIEQGNTYREAVATYQQSYRRFVSIEAAYDNGETGIDAYLAARKTHEAAGDVFNAATAAWELVNPPTHF